jgi:hypothetical protein
MLPCIWPAGQLSFTDPVLVAPDKDVSVREPKATLDVLAEQAPVSASATGAFIWAKEKMTQQHKVATRRSFTHSLCLNGTYRAVHLCRIVEASVASIGMQVRMWKFSTTDFMGE